MTCTDSMTDYRANYCGEDEAPNHIYSVLALYAQMPGAPETPTQPDGTVAWLELMGSQHWIFCEGIVDTIGEAVKMATSRAKGKRK